jgi:hypothetical protein
MTSEEWEQMKQHVNDAMRSYTRPFVTPLTMDRPAINKVTLEGTGNYVMVEGNRLILTCEHVAKRGDLDFRFYGSDDVFGFRGKCPNKQHPTVAKPDMRRLHDHRGPAQQDDFVAPVKLVGFAGRKAQRHIG